VAKRIRGIGEVLPVLPLQPPADFIYGEVRTAFERASTPIGANDLLVAAHAIAAACILVTANLAEFARIPGLSSRNWLA
jgi:tRNA(fMet)-specific endonuclease VapC